eukprot:CAMPEP_0194289368 /NCGR_PEP_ID=MMETSP0169-20130528/38946_1 /TAXON_ID=218684 /ORGANISM="Corethron pennatum, Strain L29A3" /LENGTH=399 /DNA_ID=CAMNT_0039036631 /DNA_START=487 /DNA_END=1683 /DNA_ORIENTATION=-
MDNKILDFREENNASFFSRKVTDMFKFGDETYPNFSSPLFPSLPGHKNLGFFNNNHFGLRGNYLCAKLNYTPPCTTWVYGFIDKKNETVQPMTDDFTLSDSEKAEDRQLYVQPMTVDFTLSDSEKAEDRPLYDCHGGAILDIDGDGHLDVYIANGAGKGIGEGRRYSSVLLWGSETKEDIDWSISGGAELAWDSNLENHGGNGRGRSAYFADFNSDGLIDVILVNIERLDGISATSQIFYNQGDRNFVPDNFFSEYISVIIYADSKRAKHRSARSLIMQRSHCKLKSVFCENHVEQSWAVYSYDSKKGRMKKTYDTINPIPGIPLVKSIQMADLNRDGVMDLFLFAPKSGVHIFYSTKTTSAIYTMMEEGIKSSEDILTHNGEDMSLAVMDDFNLDGNM